MEPYISLITLGVKDLKKSFAFYKDILGLPSEKGIEGDVAFFQLRNIWLSLYPRDLLVKDAQVEDVGKGFSGITLAHNVKSEEAVDALIKKLRGNGVRITKEPEKAEWGGYSAYFQDPDGYNWEVACNPFSDLTRED